MEEEVQLQLLDTEDMMKKAFIHLEDELARVRAGKASPSILDGIQVDYYGSMTPLSQVSNVNTPDARTISVQPWEKSMIEPIEKAILAANIGLTPMNNGELIRINIPVLTEERRRDLVKQIKNMAENSRVSIRTARRDANEAFKKMKKDGLSEDIEKDAEGQVQELTDKFIARIDKLVEAKEKDIMTI
ncbi:MAG: ribosome recycling factor [Bacteroidales bacterium]|nr:ribosome recycling factor [Bacteroidales bacterium]MBN2817814.1 ribosome recycling factor [Bacteroidales bacterium]